MAVCLVVWCSVLQRTAVCCFFSFFLSFFFSFLGGETPIDRHGLGYRRLSRSWPLPLLIMADPLWVRRVYIICILRFRRRAAMCCSVLQCFAVCCSVLQCLLSFMQRVTSKVDHVTRLWLAHDRDVINYSWVWVKSLYITYPWAIQ